MSYSFKVDDCQPFTYEQLFGGIDYPKRVGCMEAGPADDEVLLSGTFPTAAVHHVYVRGVSTRPVELELQGRTFCARVRSGACPEDYRLALTSARRIAILSTTQVSSEDGVRFDPDDWSEHYGTAWINRQIVDDVMSIFRKAQESEVVPIPGVNRTFYVGPRTLVAISQEADAYPGGPTADLFERIRSLQYLEETDIHVVSPVLIDENPADGKLTTVAIWAAGTTYLISPVTFVHLDADYPLLLRFWDLSKIPGLEVTWIDDGHLLIEAIAADAWDDLIARARPLSVGDGMASLRKPPPKKWWQVWK